MLLQFGGLGWQQPACDAALRQAAHMLSAASQAMLACTESQLPMHPELCRTRCQVAGLLG